MVLDDDDMLTDPDAIEALKAATIDRPELVVFKAHHGRLGVLPSVRMWGSKPLKGHIGSCDFITRRDVWERHIAAFGEDECGDFYFLKSVWRSDPEVVWLDRQLSAVQRISRGAPE